MNRILIVDDTKSWILFHTETIKQLYGDIFDITVAESATQAIDIVKHNIDNPFDLIITDLQMETDFEPLNAGEWLIEQVNSFSSYKNTQIVIISAMYNIEMIARKYNVECLSKTLLIRNKLLLKFMFEKLMPFLTQM